MEDDAEAPGPKPENGFADGEGVKLGADIGMSVITDGLGVAISGIDGFASVFFCSVRAFFGDIYRKAVNTRACH